MSAQQHDVFERGLPASIDAERAILGGILLENTLWDETETISALDFALDSHRRIYSCMASLYEAGRAIDIVTLAEELHSRREVEHIGGISYLASLTEGLPRRISIHEYVRIVREKATLRRLIGITSATMTAAADQTVNVAELITSTDAELLALTAETPEDDEPLAAASEKAFARLMELRDANQEIIGIPTGVPDLDTVTSGYVEGEFTVVAGRPGQGKTSLLVQALIECGMQQIPAHCFQLELTKEAMLWRMWAAVGRVPFHNLRNPRDLHRVDVTALENAKRIVNGFPLILETNPNINAARLVAKARISKRKHSTRFVGLDYLQKMNFDGAETRQIGVTDAAVKLANLAKKERLAVVCLSSLTEKTGRFRNQAPTLADLRSSGDIQYEASTVVFVHREVDEESEEIKADGLLITAKQRNGRTGKIPITYTRFMTFARSEGEEHGTTTQQYTLGEGVA